MWRWFRQTESRSSRRPDALHGWPGWLERFSRREVFWPLLYITTFTLLAGLISASAIDRNRYAEGEIATAPIIARVDFRTIDKDETDRRQADARDREPAVFDINQPYLDQVRDQLNALYRLGADQTITSMEQLTAADRERYQLDAAGKALAELQRFNAQPNQPPTWASLTRQLLDELASIPLLSDADAVAERNPAQRAPGIVIRHPSRGELERYDNLIISVRDVDVFRERVAGLVEKLQFPPAIQPGIVAAVMANLQPLYTLNKDETRIRKERAFAQEKPVERSFRANEVILPAGRTLTKFDLRALQEEQRAYEAALAPTERWIKLAGLWGMVLLLTIALWTYIRAYNFRLLRNPTRGLALTALLLLCHGLAIGLAHLEPDMLLAATGFPVLLATIVLAIAYDRRFALACGMVLTALVTLTLNLSVGQGLTLLAGAGVAAVQLSVVRTRSKLVMVGVWTGLTMAIVCLLSGLVERYLALPTHVRPGELLLGLLMRSPSLPDQVRALRFETLLTLATGLFTGMFVQLALPAIERLFKVTTAMTLKELLDASHPLLRRLAQEAPGTYQHSLRLADLAGAAAEAIGADALLCKVGAMYHDIGKISKPEYFVENQADGVNRHTHLAPSMSMLIIVGHVRDGLELARAYDLPSVVRQFIETHQGTTLVEYFYHAARQASAQTHTPPPAEVDYRYPGPRPQTREAAILMLCDGIESAARAMTNPTHARLEELVHQIANKRLADGQFDECPITLADLRKVEEALVRTLAAMYHGRIAYPTVTPRAQSGG